jgi:hypothetical protein
MTTAWIKLSKLDRRHTGTEHFKYRVRIDGSRDDRVKKFLEIRQWCWDTWGASAERDFAVVETPTHWAWHTGRDILYEPLFVYLVSDADASFFKLKWC